MADPGDTCKLRYRWNGEPNEHPAKGDVLETNTGRRYLILRVSGHRTHEPNGKVLKWLGPLHLEVRVMYPDDEVPEAARVFPLVWDRRKKKRG